jgi:AraC-like DNA-binding protein
LPQEQSRLLFRNDHSTSLGRLSLAGYLHKADRSEFKTMRVLGSYALVYLLAGSGSYRDANDVARELAAGDLIVLYPEIAHRYGPRRGGEWSEIYVVFDGAAFDLWRAKGVLRSDQPILHLEPVSEWLARLEETLLPVVGQTAQSALTNVSAFLNLLTAMCAPQFGDAAPREEEWLAFARHCLAENLSAPLDIRKVAREAGMSYESFRKRFAAATGTPPARYRTERRIAAAQTLLTRSNLTLRAVAMNLGYSDEFHFSRRFKEITGKTPREWRLKEMAE